MVCEPGASNSIPRHVKGISVSQTVVSAVIVSNSGQGGIGGTHSLTLSLNGTLIARQLTLSILPAPETATLYHPESAFCIAAIESEEEVSLNSVHVKLSSECHHLYFKGSGNVPSFVKSAFKVIASLSHTSVSPSIVTGGVHRRISISSMAKSLPLEAVQAFLISSLIAVFPAGTVKFIPTNCQCAEFRHSPGMP